MLTADNISRTKFNLNKLALYIDVLFSMDANYFNFTVNEFEPLLERFNMGVTMIQVAPFSKSKCYVTSNDVINFNLSTDGNIALNKFLLTYYQDEKMWENEMTLIYGPILSQASRATITNLISEDTKDVQKEIGTEIVLKFVNDSELDVVFYFDDNPSYKITLKKKRTIRFTRFDLSKARGHDKYKNP